MPEHIHLLVSEPEVKDLAKAIQALKISVARRRMRYHDKDGTTLWQKRYYDHNVRTYEWSSFRHYRMAEAGVVEIESQWTSDRREGRTGIMLRVPNQ